MNLCMHIYRYLVFSDFKDNIFSVTPKGERGLSIETMGRADVSDHRVCNSCFVNFMALDLTV